MESSVSSTAVREPAAGPSTRHRIPTWSPSTPPAPSSSLPHSTSNPSLSHSTSNPNLYSPNTPNKNASSKNYHPYLIQSTSSSLLTRSNSSPSQPIHALGRHKPSRSMSSLSQYDVKEGTESESEKGNRRKSLEIASPGVGGVRRPLVRSRRSGTLPSFMQDGKGTPKEKDLQLPSNPKLWTASELASYLGKVLRTGGEDGTGQILPAPLVEDIKSWVLRQQVTGRAFLRGNAESWGSSSRPPPFLPLLMTVSRRLRRASFQGGVPDPLDSSNSVLLETDEEATDGEISGVRRMANALEMRESQSASDVSSASEAEDEGRVLRAQLTGGSQGWERWGVKRHHTGGSVGASAGVAPSEVLGSSPEEKVVTPLMDLDSHMEIEEEDEKGGTIKAVPPGLTDVSTSEEQDENSMTQLLDVVKPQSLEGTPRRDRSRSEVTPTPERPIPTSSGLGFSPDIAPSLPGTISPATSPVGSRYSSLKTKGRVPTLRGKRPSAVDGYDTSDEGVGGTSRKATLRPSHAHISTIFDLEEPQEKVAKSVREVELEMRLAEVMERVKLLETKLEEASRPSSPSLSSSSALSRRSRISSGPVEYLLGRLGVVGKDDDGMPTRVGELPGYLFLVGFGVGAVMMRVLFGRAR